MLFSTELRGRGCRRHQATLIREQHPTPRVQPATSPDAHLRAGRKLDGDRNRSYDQTSPVIGSAVAALFA
jgi:hypothetical protein